MPYHCDPFDPIRQHGDEFRRSAPTAPDVEATIAKARRDPSAFVAFCFADPVGKRLRQARFQKELQDFLSRHRKALIELPRDHGKSTQICARAIWELGNDPSLRIKIVCATEGIAAERGRFLREAIAGNPRVREVFPRLRTDSPWTETRFSIERPASVIGPSVTALGIGGGLTGTRADLLICDDIVDVHSLASRAERDRVKSFFRDNLMNLLEPDGRCWCLFTPWHRDDLNAELKRNAAFQLFRRAIADNFAPIWEERWPRRRLRERKEEVGAASFARGYRLTPLTEETAAIRAEWIRFWLDANPPPCPPPEAGGGKAPRPVFAPRAESPVATLPPLRGEGRVGGSAFDRIVLAVDPAVSTDARADASGLVVLGARYGSFEAVGYDRINEICCLDAIACRVRLPELVQRLEALDRRWDPQVILFESNAAFAGIRDLLTRQARFGGKIKEIVQSRSKAIRVEAFSVPVQNGVFRLKGARSRPLPQPLPEAGRGENHSYSPPRFGEGLGEGFFHCVDPSQQALFDEMILFPVGEHDDLLDAAAMGTEYLLNTREPRIW